MKLLRALQHLGMLLVVQGRQRIVKHFFHFLVQTIFTLHFSLFLHRLNPGKDTFFLGMGTGFSGATGIKRIDET